MRRATSSYKQDFFKTQWRRKSKFCTIFLKTTLQYMSAGLSEDFDIYKIFWAKAERIMTCLFEFWSVTAIFINGSLILAFLTSILYRDDWLALQLSRITPRESAPGAQTEKRPHSRCGNGEGIKNKNLSFSINVVTNCKLSLVTFKQPTNHRAPIRTATHFVIFRDIIRSCDT